MENNCKKCGNKLALMDGILTGYPDSEPYRSGEEVELNIDVDIHVNFYWCEKCNDFENVFR